MLSEGKQNIFDLDKPSTSQSTRRHSTFSTSACKKMLKSICEDSQNNHHQSSGSSGDITLRQMKLKQAIAFLQKKNAKQTQQITVLTQDLNTLTKIRQKQLKGLEQQMQKIKLTQVQKNQQSKTISELKKKISELESSNTALRNKNNESQKKFIKLKQLLRRKEVTISEMQSKAQSNDSLETTMVKQKEEIASLRENFIKIKEKQNNFEDENQLLRAKLSEYKKENCQLKTKVWLIQQSNKRLQQQCQQLEEHYEQSSKQAQNIQRQAHNALEQQKQEINRLMEIIKKIQTIEQENKSTNFCSIYKDEISQILKQNVIDKGTRGKIEKKIHQVLESMEQSMNRIIMQVVATNV